MKEKPQMAEAKSGGILKFGSSFGTREYFLPG